MYVNHHFFRVTFCIVVKLTVVNFSLCNNRSILVRVVRNSEHNPGAVGIKPEYTRDGMPVHHRAPCTYASIHSFTIGVN